MAAEDACLSLRDFLDLAGFLDMRSGWVVKASRSAADVDKTRMSWSCSMWSDATVCEDKGATVGLWNLSGWCAAWRKDVFDL